VVAALEQVWQGIRARHPELPAVVVVLAAGSVGTPRGMLKLGHFAAMRWDHGGDALPEVFVGGEGLARGAVDVLGTLLHEATHALAHARGIKDTSRQGRYHNRRFATLAGELGLDIRETALIGWSDTGVPEATVEEYQDELNDLRHALTIHRRAEGLPRRGDADDEAPGGAPDRPSSNNGHSCRCGCGRRIRVSPTVLAAGPIICSLCSQPFAPAS
jgi:hypothetical protein